MGQGCILDLGRGVCEGGGLRTNTHGGSHVVFFPVESCPKQHHLNRHLLQSAAITWPVFQLKGFVYPH